MKLNETVFATTRPTPSVSLSHLDVSVLIESFQVDTLALMTSQSTNSNRLRLIEEQQMLMMKKITNQTSELEKSIDNVNKRLEVLLIFF